MSSIGILITSRNNYDFMAKFWAKRINAGHYPVLNIDEDSKPEQKALGQQICKEYGFNYIDREKRGMLNNIDTAIRFFGDSIKYIVWFQTDCWPLQTDFFDRFNTLVESGQLDEFGAVGFNGMADNILETHNYEKLVGHINDDDFPIAVVARSPLEEGDSWYCGVKSRRIKDPILKHHLFRNAFSVEIVAWFAAAINVSQFKKHMDLAHPFEWFHCWDDICFQFLNKNIHNVTIPWLFVDHRPDLKPAGGSPLRAVRLAYKGDNTYHSLVGFTEKEWKKVWGFEYDNRKTFKKCKDRYRDTLLMQFYRHKMQDGPLRIFPSICQN